MRWREHEWTEPHGEPCRQEWVECQNTECGAKFDIEEMDAIHKPSREA
jgi:hypothetical protein